MNDSKESGPFALTSYSKSRIDPSEDRNLLAKYSYLDLLHNAWLKERRHSDWERVGVNFVVHRVSWRLC